MTTERAVEAVVVAIDMVGFSGVTQSLPSYMRNQALTILENQIQEFAAAAAQLTGAPLRGKRMGDGQLLCFEDAVTAEAFAREFQERVAAFNNQLDESDAPLRFRIGIASGKVRIARLEVEDDPYSDSLWGTGEVTNWAARLEHACDPGNILVHENTCNDLVGSVLGLYDSTRMFEGKPHDPAIPARTLKDPLYRALVGTKQHQGDSTQWLRRRVAGWTAIALVEEDPQSTHYRGTPIASWIDRGFEATAYALLFGNDRNAPSFESFVEQLVTHRTIPDSVKEFIAEQAAERHPMDVLRTAVSFSGLVSSDAANLHTDVLGDKAIRIIAQLPTIVAHIVRANADAEGPAPSLPMECSHAEYVCHALFGSNFTSSHRRLIERCMILYAEHGFAASTFAARVVVSTDADIVDGVVAALGALRGWKHGGASEFIWDDLLQYRLVELRVSQLPNRIPGWGHPLLEGDDPRVELLETAIADELSGLGDGEATAQYEKYRKFIDVIERDPRIVRRGLRRNLEFPAAICLAILGLSSKYFTPVFAMGRVAGWCSHIIEHRRYGKLIRPRSLYDPAAISRNSTAEN